jgi:hypothetical protein
MRPITISADNLRAGLILRFCSGSTTSRAWRCNPLQFSNRFSHNLKQLPKTLSTRGVKGVSALHCPYARTESRASEDIVYWTTPACHSGNPTSL